MDFLESPRFPARLSLGARGGPGYKTLRTETLSGFVQRLSLRSQALHVFQVGLERWTKADTDELLGFFHIVGGMAVGFRFKYWLDFSVNATTGVLVQVAGFPGVYQLAKLYVSGASSKQRLIFKPTVSPAAALTRTGVPMVVGGGAGQYALATTTGRVTIVADSIKTITAITKANPGVITATAHGFTTGTQIGLAAIGGMTQLNGTIVTITNLTADAFSIGVDTTAYGTYTSGGTASKFPQSSETLAWAGEFDLPCTFGVDSMDELKTDEPTSDGNYFVVWPSIPIIETPIEIP